MTLADYFNELKAATLLAGKEVLTIEEAAMMTGYEVGSIYQFKAKGEIPCYKRGNKIYFKKSELVAWMTSNRIPTKEEKLRAYETAQRQRRRNKQI